MFQTLNPLPHPCPGCGATAEGDEIACQSCLSRLPTQLRLEIANGDAHTQQAAGARAEQWLQTGASIHQGELDG